MDSIEKFLWLFAAGQCIGIIAVLAESIVDPELSYWPETYSIATIVGTLAGYGYVNRGIRP